MTIFKLSNLRQLAAATALMLGVAVAPQMVLADGDAGHTHSKAPATKEQILESATKMRDKLIGDKKIEATWKAIAPDNAEQKEFGKKKEWLVTFKDPKATDKTKETLYMFFSLPGNYLAVNYTGK